MTSQRTPYARAFKKYRWDYLKLELEVAESLSYVGELQAQEAQLTRDVEDVLKVEADPVMQFSSEHRSNVLALASRIAAQQEQCSERLYENRTRLAQLRLRLLRAKKSYERVRDRFYEARLHQRSLAERTEALDLSDQSAARRLARR